MVYIKIGLFSICFFGGITMFMWSLIKLQIVTRIVKRNQTTIYSIRPPSFYLMTLILSFILFLGVILIN